MFKITEESVLEYMERLGGSSASAEVVGYSIGKKYDEDLAKQAYNILDMLSKQQNSRVKKEGSLDAKVSESDYRNFQFSIIK